MEGGALMEHLLEEGRGGASAARGGGAAPSGAIVSAGGKASPWMETEDAGRRTRRGLILAASVLTIAAVLFLGAGFVTYGSLTEASGKPVVGIGGPDGENEFFAASRTGFHFQPEKNWMNDPNAPMYYKGWYHFFYQYNPEAAFWWYDIAWGHAVSKDMIHWTHLEVALYPDKWYDIAGVWSGSATILEDGTPAILYTGGRIMPNNSTRQVQCLALPVDPEDPLLRKWQKVEENPIILPETPVLPNDFRDPTTAWRQDDGYWRVGVGAKIDNRSGDNTMDGFFALYKSKDFVKWEKGEPLHYISNSGMWECPDFYPISVEGAPVTNQSFTGYNYLDHYKYVLKASMVNQWGDFYTIGSYSTKTDKFIPDDPNLDLTNGYQFDYGRFYASKTFFDSTTGRRILWAWVNESDTANDDIAKGWASLQTIPRTLWLDPKASKGLLQWPIEEVETLRTENIHLEDMVMKSSDIIKVDGAFGAQLDILVDFKIPNLTEADSSSNTDLEEFDCSQGGSAHRGVFGPFGLLVNANEQLSEHTGIFFYISRNGGKWVTKVCSDQSRSSLATGLDTSVFGTYVNVLPTETELSLRVLVDHSIVETFVQGGRLAITSRVYPTLALGPRANLYLFNNGTTPITITNMDVYQMASAQSNTL